jgi:CDP-4-dehydro-6-deoxyglucose reductase
VRTDENVLAAALAAGIPIPHSCRAGRCASCKSRLVSGNIEYPSGTPPGITDAEIARGEVLLCQARPRSDLVVEARLVPVKATPSSVARVVARQPGSLGTLHLRLAMIDSQLELQPGQFAEVSNREGDSERLPVVDADVDIVEIESPDDGSSLYRWLLAHAQVGTELRVAGPFDSPRKAPRS